MPDDIKVSHSEEPSNANIARITSNSTVTSGSTTASTMLPSVKASASGISTIPATTNNNAGNTRKKQTRRISPTISFAPSQESLNSLHDMFQEAFRRISLTENNPNINTAGNHCKTVFRRAKLPTVEPIPKKVMRKHHSLPIARTGSIKRLEYASSNRNLRGKKFLTDPYTKLIRHASTRELRALIQSEDNSRRTSSLRLLLFRRVARPPARVRSPSSPDNSPSPETTRDTAPTRAPARGFSFGGRREVSSSTSYESQSSTKVIVKNSTPNKTVVKNWSANLNRTKSSSNTNNSRSGSKLNLRKTSSHKNCLKDISLTELPEVANKSKASRLDIEAQNKTCIQKDACNKSTKQASFRPRLPSSKSMPTSSDTMNLRTKKSPPSNTHTSQITRTRSNANFYLTKLPSDLVRSTTSNTTVLSRGTLSSNSTTPFSTRKGAHHIGGGGTHHKKKKHHSKVVMMDGDAAPITGDFSKLALVEKAPSLQAFKKEFIHKYEMVMGAGSRAKLQNKVKAMKPKKEPENIAPKVSLVITKAMEYRKREKVKPVIHHQQVILHPHPFK